jgi:3-hydroxyacyl-[acyl-carrier-protein] dehydratase
VSETLAMLLDVVQVQARLPHRYPFLFIDRVSAFEDLGEHHKRIVAHKLVSIADPILQGHFPGHPVLPGVVQVEAMAQAAVLLASLAGQFDAATHHCYFLGIQGAKFRGPAVPGDLLDIEVSSNRLGRIGKFEGVVRCGGDVRSSAEFTAIVEPRRDLVPGT